MIPIQIDKTPIRRRRGTSPFGYYPDPNNPRQLLPNIAQLEVLEAGLNYRLAGHSARRVAAWVSTHAKHPFDHRQIDRHLERQIHRQRLRQRELPPLPALPEVLSDAT